MVTGGCVERWRAVVAEQEKSGESVTEYCAGRGLSRWTLYEWRRRLRAERARTFVPVTVVTRPASLVAAPAAGSSAGIEIVLGSGRRLRLERGFDPAALSAAVRALEARAC